MSKSFNEFSDDYMNTKRGELIRACVAVSKERRLEFYIKLNERIDIFEMVFVDRLHGGRSYEMLIDLLSCGSVRDAINSVNEYLDSERLYTSIPPKQEPQKHSSNLPFELNKFIDGQISKRDRGVSIFQSDDGVVVSVYPCEEVE